MSLGDFAALQWLATEDARLAAEEERLTAELKAVQARRRHLQQVEMVDLLNEGQLQDVVGQDGTRYVLDTWVSGSWPKQPDASDRAARHLADLGAEGLIKTTVTAEFPKDARVEAMDAYTELSKRATPKLYHNVHHSTLKAFARRRLAAGDPIQLEALGLKAGQRVLVKRKQR